jgi:hypothetical protein
MRMVRRVAAVVIAAAVSTGLVSGAALAGEETQSGVTQTFDVTVKPSKKLPKKDTKKVDPKGVSVNIAVGISEATQQKPPPAERVLLDLDRDLFITNKGLAECSENEIATATSAAARSVCKKSVVGLGSATATCGAGPPSIPDVIVTAFNGTPNGKKDVVLLHTYADLGGTAQVQILPAVLKNAPGKEQGIRADIAVPPLAGGACSIVDFQVTLKERYKSKGKTYDFVSAVCSDKKFEHESTFNYTQPNTFNVAQLEPSSEQGCKAS